MQSQSEETLVAPPDLPANEDEESWEHKAIPELQALTIKYSPPSISNPGSDDGKRLQNALKT